MNAALRLSQSPTEMPLLTDNFGRDRCQCLSEKALEARPANDDVPTMKPRPIRSLLLTFVSTISTFTLFALPWVASAQSAADYRRMAQAERDKARSVGGSQGEIYLRAADAYENAARQREGLEDRKRDQEQKTRDLSEKLQSLQLNNAAATRNLNKANSLNSARDTFNKGLNDLGEILIRRQQEQAEKAERASFVDRPRRRPSPDGR